MGGFRGRTVGARALPAKEKQGVFEPDIFCRATTSRDLTNGSPLLPMEGEEGPCDRLPHWC